MSYTKPYLHSPAWSDECYRGGNGQCDGIVYQGPYIGEECGCGCHTSLTGWGDTVKEVEQAHIDFWKGNF